MVIKEATTFEDLPIVVSTTVVPSILNVFSQRWVQQFNYSRDDSSLFNSPKSLSLFRSLDASIKSILLGVVSA